MSKTNSNAPGCAGSHADRGGNGRTRRNWTPQKKRQIVLESLHGDQRLAELCRREGLSPTQVYQWRKQLTGAAETIFVRKVGPNRDDPRIARLSAETARMKSVIAEITAENLPACALHADRDLKKTLSG